MSKYHQDKSRTLSIDLDNVIHRYNSHYQGRYNIYDEPMEGAVEAIKELHRRGWRLIILTCRPIRITEKWLEKYGLLQYFEEVSNIKQPAKVYIDDRAYLFQGWDKVLNDFE